MPNEEPRLTMSAEEFARRLGFKVAHVYSALRAGQIPSIKIGRLYRIPIAVFDRMWARATEDSDAA